jgi:hypothetical protein
MNFPQPPTLQHQQSVLQWLIKSYTKDFRGYYCDWIVSSPGYFNENAYHGKVFGTHHGIEKVIISKGAKQATLNEIYQRQQGFGELYLPGVEYLPYTMEHSYMAAVNLHHTMALIHVKGSTPVSLEWDREDYDNNNNGGNNDNNNNNFDGELDDNFMVDEEEQFAHRGGGDNGDNDNNNNGDNNDNNDDEPDG